MWFGPVLDSDPARKTMSYRRYSVPPAFPAPNPLPPGCLLPGMGSLGCPGQHQISRYSTHYHLLFPVPLKGFLKAPSHLSPSCSISTSNAITWRSTAQSHIFIFAHINMRRYEWMTRCMPVCARVVSPAGLWGPHSLMYISHTHMCTHAPSTSDSSSLV